MDLIVIISELITLILCIISLYLLYKFYHKMKLKLISFAFSSIILIWMIKSISRILSCHGIIGIPDVEIWSIVGVLQSLLLIVVFWYYIKVSEKYL